MSGPKNNRRNDRRLSVKIEVITEKYYVQRDSERYLELHSHDQDSTILMEMQGVINALHESMHHQ